jgi:FtsH-binding integral membrane protein
MDSNQISGNSYNNWEQPDNIQFPASVDAGYVAKYITKVYGWMFLGLLLTGIIAGMVASNDQLVAAVINFRMILFIGQIVMVGFLALRVHKMSSVTATAIFLGYAALNGLTFAILFRMFSAGSLATVFAITAGTFGIMSAVGYFTKQDLTSFGRIMLMGLVGIIIASLVNLFVQSPALYWIISYVGVAVFVGLIAYDTQKIKAYALLDSEEDRKKGAILGALALYLDFINLFVMLLRLFGGSRN